MSGYPFPSCPHCGKRPAFTGAPACYCEPQEARQIMRELHRQTSRNPAPLDVPPLRLTSPQAPPQRTPATLPLFEDET